MGRETTTVLLDPDGTHDIGHYVLVERQTGVRYETQCGGLATLTRSAEGYLVSVGPRNDVGELMGWVEDRHNRGHGLRPVSEWSDADVSELANRVAGLQIWFRESDGEDRPRQLTLNRAKLDDCHEAWIPVSAGDANGYLLGANSD